MSKPIPQEEYNRKPLTRLMQWVGGDIDPFMENMEVRPQRERKPNERLIRKHRRDQEAVIRLVHDQKHNRVYKNFRRFYTIASIICCLALVAILLWRFLTCLPWAVQRILPATKWQPSILKTDFRIPAL